METAIAGAANAIFFNHGQCCNAGSRLYVQKDSFDDVVAGVAEAAKTINVAPGTDEDSEMGPLISDEQFRQGARATSSRASRTARPPSPAATARVIAATSSSRRS